jgi:rod shape-determining protein MreD
MKRILFITLVVYLCFLSEYLLANILGRWFKPDLVIIAVVFFNLYLGIRYSLYAAAAGGILKDCFSVSFMGTHMLVYFLCAYVTTLAAKNIYQRGSVFLRLVLVLIALGVSAVARAVFHVMSVDLSLEGALAFVILPEMAWTLIAASFVFERLLYWSRKVGL